MSPMLTVMLVIVPLCWKASVDCSSGAICPSSVRYVARFCRAAGAASTVSGIGPACGFLPHPANAAIVARANSVAFMGVEGNVILSISFLNAVLHSVIYGAQPLLIQRTLARRLS